MKIFSSEQIRAIDAYTIAEEPISSIYLMERAARVCVKRLIKLIKFEEPIYIFCGMGNNGGDGFAMARLLSEQGYTIKVCSIHYTENFSADALINYTAFKERFPSQVIDCFKEEELIAIQPEWTAVAIDALLGTGLNKPVEGLLGEAIKFTNSHFRKIISIDIPSGLYADKSSTENKFIICSSLTLSFQFPKLAFLFAENKSFVPEFEILDIGLHEKGIAEQSSPYFYITRSDISGLLKKRNKFSHKGTYGHALLLAGSKGKSGAAIISSKACLRSGAGLFTLHSTSEAITALLHQLPEAMSDLDPNADHISEIEKPEKYSALGIGPGIGLHEDTQQVLKKILHYYAGPLVIDADALNILSENKTWLNFLPANSILTPHSKEFERLSEKATDDFERIKLLKHFSMKYNCIVILKDAHTAIAMPDGHVFFNSSGNAGLAKGGSGDALTGIILGLLSRGYTEAQASLIGTFVHGYAADLCIRKKSMESLLISDVIAQLAKTFKKLEELKN